MRVILSGGGSGGHVVPNLAVIEELRDEDLLYIGSKDGMEKRIVKEAGVRYVGISCGKLRRYFSWENFVDAFRVPIGVVQAWRVLRRFRPDVVFSKGGYVAFPVTVAAWVRGVPVVVHESDVVPGLANRLGFRFASVICLSFEESRKYLKKKAVVTGNPVREELLKGVKAAGLRFCGLKGGRKVLLVMGGGQGAMEINEKIWSGLDELLEEFDVVHQVGKGNMRKIERDGYAQFEFIGKEMKDVFAIADLVVTRAGANSLAEIALLGKRAVMVPMVLGSRGDQIVNAKLFSKKMNWKVVSGKISVPKFSAIIKKEMRRGASKKKFENGLGAIVQIIKKFAK